MFLVSLKHVSHIVYTVCFCPQFFGGWPYINLASYISMLGPFLMQCWEEKWKIFFAFLALTTLNQLPPAGIQISHNIKMLTEAPGEQSLATQQLL